MKAIRALDRAMTRLDRFAMLVSNLMLLAILFVSTVDVAMRYGLNRPLSFTYDLISLYLMTGLFFFAVSDTLRNNEHVSVDLLHTRMSPRQRHLALFISLALSCVVFLLMAWVAWDRMTESWSHKDVVTGAIEWPTWVSALFVALGLSMLSARALLRVMGHGLSALTATDVIPLPLISGAQGAE